MMLNHAFLKAEATMTHATVLHSPQMTSAGNRCYWLSACELASFIRTGADCRRTHVPVHVFLSRPSWLLHECQRILSQPKDQLIEVPDISDDSMRTLDVLLFESIAQEVPGSVAQSVSTAAHPAAATSQDAALQREEEAACKPNVQLQEGETLVEDTGEANDDVESRTSKS